MNPEIYTGAGNSFNNFFLKKARLKCLWYIMRFFVEMTENAVADTSSRREDLWCLAVSIAVPEQTDQQVLTYYEKMRRCKDGVLRCDSKI